MAPSEATTITAIALRLLPGQDLKHELDRYVQQHQIQAACILTCVGSLTQAVLRFAGQADGILHQGRFEIVSLVGTLSVEGLHLHMAIADSTGRTLGGHVMTGCTIYTTAEVVLGSLPDYRFVRKLDQTTGYRELTIEHQVPVS